MQPTSRTGDQWRFRSKGSLAVVVAGPQRGHWFDHQAGRGSDALALVAHLRCCSIREAYVWAVSWLGGQQRLTPSTGASRAGSSATRSPRSTLHMARSIWAEAQTAEGTLVEAYLTSRGLKLPNVAALRFHPACPRGAERLPAMVAMMTGPVTNDFCGVHRTYLAADGRSKASEPAKMMAGKMGIIRLVPNEEVTQGLGLAEGIETALSVMQIYRWTPVWAATSAGAISNFPVLHGIDCVTAFSDNDESGAGLKAATRCSERWLSAGVEFVDISSPRPGDWNDMARRRQ